VCMSRDMGGEYRGTWDWRYVRSRRRTSDSVRSVLVIKRLLISNSHTERVEAHLGFSYWRTRRRRFVKALDKRSNRRDDRHDVL
jgi:hypothetical protein